MSHCLPLSSIEAQPAPSLLSPDLQDFKLDVQHVIEVDEGNTAVIACHLPESHPKAQVRYSVKHEWLEASRGEPSGRGQEGSWPSLQRFPNPGRHAGSPSPCSSAVFCPDI